MCSGPRFAPDEGLDVLVVVMVHLFLEEVRVDVERGVQVEAADVEDLLDVGFAEMHLLLVRARVHVAQAAPVARFVSFSATRSGLGQEDPVREAHLRPRFIVIVERLRAVLRVDHGHDGVQEVLVVDLLVHEERLRDGARIGKPRGLDDDAVELELSLAPFLPQVAKNAHQVAAHGAAQAPVVHLDDLLFLVLHEDLVVDAGLAELVLDDGDLLAVLLGEDAVEERGLAGAEEAGEDGDGNEVFVGSRG
jgi:hypothetical protein